MRSSYVIIEPTAPVETDLVSLADLKSDLGITGTTEDAALELQITRVSKAFAEYTNRDFALLTIAETFVFGVYDVWPRNNIGYLHWREYPLMLHQYPVGEIQSVLRDGVEVTDYEIDYANGFLYLPSGVWSGTVVVTYTGGYDLPTNAPALLAWAVIEAIRYRRVFSVSDPSVRQKTTTHGDTTVSTGYYSEPLEAFAGFPGSVIKSLETFRRPPLA